MTWLKEWVMCIRILENQIVCPTVLDDASYGCLNYAMEDYKERGKNALQICGPVLQDL